MDFSKDHGFLIVYEGKYIALSLPTWFSSGGVFHKSFAVINHVSLSSNLELQMGEDKILDFVGLMLDAAYSLPVGSLLWIKMLCETVISIPSNKR